MQVSLLNHQLAFVSSKENTLLVAGYGAGKSYAGTIKTIIKKLENPKYKVAYYLPTYPLIRDIAFDKFTEVLEELKIKYKLNKADKELHIHGNSSILFRTLSEPETIVGYETAYALIDEADILAKDKMDLAFNKVLGRNRAVTNASVDCVSTPEGFKWLYEQSQSGKFKVIKARTLDNKFLPPSYIEQLRESYTAELLEAYLEGNFVNLTSGTVYSYFDRDKHTTDVEILPKETLYIGQDFNVQGCVSIVCVIRNNKPYVVEEFVSDDTYGIINNIRIKYPNNPDITIYPDASGYQGKTNATMTDIELLQKAKFKVNAPKRNGRVKDRVNSLNSLFEKNQLFINVKNCPNLTKALEQQAYDRNGEPEKFNGAATIDDYNDALGYFIARMFGINKQTIGRHKLKFG